MKVYVANDTLIDEKMNRVGYVNGNGDYILNNDFADDVGDNGDEVEYIEAVKFMDCSKYSGNIQVYSADITLFEDGSAILYKEGDFSLLTVL